jgi:hypothetical protein
MLGRGAVMCLLLMLGALAGCGTASTHEPLSIAGLRAADRKLSADEQAGRYASACEAFTPDLRRAFKAFRKGGCAGFFKFSLSDFHATCSSFQHGPEPFTVVPERGDRLRRDRERLRKACAHEKRESMFVPVPTQVRIAGSTAYNGRTIYAEYEGGRWRFAPTGGPLKNPAALEAALRQIGSTRDGGLPGGAMQSESSASQQSTITVGNAP